MSLVFMAIEVSTRYSRVLDTGRAGVPDSGRAGVLDSGSLCDLTLPSPL